MRSLKQLKSLNMDLSLLKSKFRGTILGVLTGDCLGSPYEGENVLSAGEKLVLQQSLDKLEGPIFKAPVMQFTDDSAMTRTLGRSLIERKGLDLIDIASGFVKNYYQEPHRGYGSGVVTVFKKLRGNKLKDIKQPAEEQFDGLGSLGNGGAMRVAPIPLFYHQNYEKMLEVTRGVTRLTHTHKLGVDGALLQAIAIHQSLLLNPSEGLDVTKFVQDLINKMDQIETDEEGLGLSEPQPYKLQLKKMKKLIFELEEEPNAKRVVEQLGNSVEALYSVPTAIFCFLKAQSPIKGIDTDNSFRRTLQYANTLGGDTDTIMSMAGAIAGAFYGEIIINSNLLHHCESSKEFADFADELLEAVHEKA